MHRRTSTLILMMILCLSATHSTGAQQLDQWALPPSLVDFSGAPTTSPLPNSPPAEDFEIANSMHDDDGNLLFYVVSDGSFVRVFNANGVPFGNLTSAFGNHEIGIAPVPGNCSRFYVIYFQSLAFIGVDLYYSIVDVELEQILDKDTRLGNYSDNYGSLAIGPLRDNGTRFLYTVSNPSVDKYEISASGISLDSTVADFPDLEFDDFFSPEADLSHDGRQLTWANGRDLKILNLNAAGDLDRIERLPITPIRAVEFSADGAFLYYSDGTTLGFVELGTGATTSLTGSEAYAHSHLEMAGDGNIYAAADDSLGLITDPNTPTSGSFAPNAVPGVTGGLVSTLGQARTLPDQIDGQVYRETFLGCTTCTDPPDRMLTWWPFERVSVGSTPDIVNQHLGLLMGDPMLVPGVVDRAMRFDGNDHIQVQPRTNNAASLDFQRRTYSVDVWIYPESGVAVETLLDKRTSVNGSINGWHIFLFDGRPGVQVTNGTSTTINRVSSQTLPLNQWSHIAINVGTGGSGTVDIYINGQLTDTFPNAFVTFNTNASLTIGRRSAGFGTAFFTGRLDEVEIHDGLLDPMEIEAIYRAGSAGKCPDRLDAPWDSQFCANAPKITARSTLCNQAAAPRTYHLSAAGRPMDTGPDPTTVLGNCDLDGPTDFDFLNGNTVTVPAGSCVEIPIEIQRPADLTGGGQIACYEVQAENPSNGQILTSLGSVQGNDDFCVVCQGGGGLTDIPFEFLGRIFFRVSNTSTTPRVFDYVLQAVTTDTNEPNPIIRLNGLEPGVAIPGSIALEPGESRLIPVDVEYTRNEPFEVASILVLTDLDQNGELSAIASAMVRSIATPGCVPSATELCLNDGRFRAEIEWTDFAGNSGVGRTGPLTDDTGTFWFFDPDNVEIAVKVLDGRELNGFWWVFYGALTNVEFTLTLTDTATGATATYRNPGGRFFSVGDTQAVAGDSATTGAARVAQIGTSDLEGLFYSQEDGAFDNRGTIRSQTVPLPQGGCIESETAVCLNGDRFQVAVEWEDFQGQTGNGMAVPLTDDTGYFWFFQDTNIELIAKLLDGRSLNGHWWFFYGALSNVRYTITVTDTLTGAVKVYVNPLSEFASRGDTTAFPQ